MIIPEDRQMAINLIEEAADAGEVCSVSSNITASNKVRPYRLLSPHMAYYHG